MSSFRDYGSGMKGSNLLKEAGVFFNRDEAGEAELNLNDVWGWAVADGEVVPEDKVEELGWLFWCYGWCGILYWVSERRGGLRSEFHDVNRMIDFVRHEEKLLAEVPRESERAYKKIVYTLGA